MNRILLIYTWATILLFIDGVAYGQQWGGLDDQTSPINRTGSVNLDGVNGSQIRLGSAGTYFGKIGNPTSQVWSLGWGGPAADINPVLNWTASGNIGIGTYAPNSLLTLNKSGTGAQTSEITLQSNLVNVARFGWNAAGYLDISSLYNNNHIILSPTGVGNVGIGTTIPDAKLTVKGTIHSQEVKVDLNVPGPDYVFDNDYALPSLDSVQSYINQNKHLPEVPSAKEMEANGINLSEMNMLLLKKVEELTLYIINQKKEMDELKMRNVSADVSGKKIDELMMRVTNLNEQMLDHKSKYNAQVESLKQQLIYLKK